MPTTDLISPFVVSCAGGLTLNKDVFSMQPGEALILQNFEPDIKGGYRRVSGTAQYNTTFDDTLNQSVITVLNSGLKGNGNYTEIKGYSYTTGNLPTKRKLHFDGVPTDGNYWIVYLGPIINKEYAYAIVSGAITKVVGTRFSLYILARNIEEYRAHYESTVKQWCKDNGYTMWWNEYVSTI